MKRPERDTEPEASRDMEAVNLDREFPGRYDLSLGSPYCHPLLSSGSLPLSLRPAGRREGSRMERVARQTVTRPSGRRDRGRMWRG